MLNEGFVSGTIRGSAKAEMVRQLDQLGEASADRWERAVFTALTGRVREDVDLDIEENRAGYCAWIRSFDSLTDELVVDDHVSVRQVDRGRARRAYAPR